MYAKIPLWLAIFPLALIAAIFVYLQKAKHDPENALLVKNCYSLAMAKLDGCAELPTRLYPDFRTTTAPLARLDLAAIGLSSSPIDSQVKFLVANEPSEVTRIAYCYFVQRGWFDPAALSPHKFSLAVDGFAILAQETAEYRSWIKSTPGLACAARVKQELGRAQADLPELIGEKLAIIMVNPLVGILAQKKADAIVENIKTTANHERIHVLQVSCPALDSYAKQLWKNLPAKEKNKVIKANAGYDWKNTTVAEREYFAYRFENSLPQLLSGPAADCRWKK